MSALVKQLRLLQAWYLPAGPEPEEAMPSKYRAFKEAADRIVELERDLAAANAEREELRRALQAILDCAEAEAKAKFAADVAVDNYSFPAQEVDRYQQAAIASSNAASHARKLLDAAIAAKEKTNG